VKQINLLIVILLVSCSGLNANELRDSISLNNEWLFHTDPENKGMGESWFSPLKNSSDWESVQIPSNWNTTNKYSLYFGKAWYRKEIEIPASFEYKECFLNFEAIYHDSKIWLNGELIGNSNSGYFPITIDVTGKLKTGKKNTVVVQADNTFKRGATFNWGGIRRPAYIIGVNKVHILDQKITPITDLKTAKVIVEVKIENSESINKSVECLISLKYNGYKQDKNTSISDAKFQIIVPAGKIVIVRKEIQINKNQLYLWNFDYPNLYTSKINIFENKTILDSNSDKFGIRKIEVDGLKLKLNGESVRLCGYNWVPDDRIHGNTLPFEQVKQDIDLMKEAGANMARLSHLPLNKEVLDYLDVKGILLVDELPLWGTDRLVDPQNEIPRQWMKSLVEQHYNHPCIITWSIGNEIGENPKVLEYEKAMHKYIKTELDSTRLIVDVSMTAQKGPNDASQFSDVVMQNAYGLGGVRNAYKQVHNNFPQKPVFYSEFGNHLIVEDPDLGELNARQLLDSIRGREYLIGCSLWTFNDYRSQFQHADPTWTTAATENRAWGVVNVFRQKKRAYYSFRKEFAPVKELSFELDGDKIKGIKIIPRQKFDLPAFILKGYNVQIEVLSNNTWNLSETIQIPIINPGDKSFMLPCKSFQNVEAVKATLRHPVGYDVLDTIIYFKKPGMVKVNDVIPYDHGVKVTFEHNITSKEYIARISNADTTYYSKSTINNFLFVSNFNKKLQYKIEILGVNDAGKSDQFITKTFNLSDKSQPPTIYAVIKQNDGFYIGYYSSKFDYLYQFDIADSPEKLDGIPDYQFTNRGCGFVNCNNFKKPIYFRMRILNQVFVDSEWSEIITVK